MADSFFMIPSKSEAPLATLEKENAALKAQVEAQQAKLVAAERMMKQRQEQDQQLRGSIMLARKEVNCSARRPEHETHMLENRHNERCPHLWPCVHHHHLWR